ncbi:MAG: ATP-binding protein [Steroidobacteraceae bacterium]
MPQFEKAFLRERAAREEAERLLESKSRELFLANQQLQQRLEELQRHSERLAETQAQLLHSERMATVGQLAAGIAHEINNPVAFVSSNLRSLEGYCTTLGQLAPGLLPALPAAERTELEYILRDLPPLLTESLEGTRRITEIVHGLRRFARADSGAIGDTDVHEALESALRIARNEIAQRCELVRDYGELPHIRACAGQLGQVFVNLVVNATQAIEGRGRITLTTRCRDGEIAIAVGDTGGGIAPENLPRLFTPFFTTKEVGRGTGLGLSTCYAIVRRHGGRIEVASEPGRGSVFTVILPVAPALDADAIAPPPDQEVA